MILTINGILNSEIKHLSRDQTVDLGNNVMQVDYDILPQDDWRHKIPDAIVDIWHLLDTETRKVAYICAKDQPPKRSVDKHPL